MGKSSIATLDFQRISNCRHPQENWRNTTQYEGSISRSVYTGSLFHPLPALIAIKAKSHPKDSGALVVLLEVVLTLYSHYSWSNQSHAAMECQSASQKKHKKQELTCAGSCCIHMAVLPVSLLANMYMDRNHGERWCVLAESPVIFGTYHQRFVCKNHSNWR